MEILLNSIIKAAGWSIIHSIWQGAILYSILLMLFIISPRLSAKTRHNLAFMALCGTAIWFTITFYNEFSARIYIANHAEFIGTYSSPITNIDHNLIRLPATLINKAEQNIPLIVFIYSMGLLLQLLYLAFGYHRIRRIKSTGLSALDDGLHRRFIALTIKLNIKRIVSFKLSSVVSVPMAVGYFKPLVLLPLSIVAQMDQDQLEAIIIHELSHIRRNDYLLNILKIGIETILFFNPFVWLSTRLIDTERENACDDLVLKLTGSPLSYAQTLLELEKLKSGQQVFALAATGNKYHLLNRIKRIVSMKTNNSNLKQQLFGIFLIAATVLSIGWINVNKNRSAARISPKTESETLKRSKAELMFQAHAGIQAHNSSFEIKADTTKKKFKIVVTDEKGNTKEYNKMQDLPDDVRAEFMKQGAFPPMPTSPVRPPMPPMPPMVDTTSLIAMTKMYDSPEWKKNIEEVQQLQKKMLDGPEWKKFNEDLVKKFQSVEWKKSMEKLKEQFDSPEWKAKMQDFQKQFDGKAWQKQNEQFEKQFNSPEWKAKMQDFQKQFESEEWRAYFDTMKNMFRDDKTGIKKDEADKKP